MIAILVLLTLFLIGWVGRMFWVASGKQPSGERLARCEQSPHWKDGKFQNEHYTPQLTGNDSPVQALWKFLFKEIPNLKPTAGIPLVKVDLKTISRDEELCLWLGHSTIFIQTGKVRFLFDPVLTNELPVWLFMRPFKGTDTYTPDDIPDIDCLVITHDHWDHLDYSTVVALRSRVRAVICPLGVGEHFEYWGYDAERIHELDWDDDFAVNPSLTLHCLPSRHFSGRLFGNGKTLWASYLIDGPRRIFVSGDGGYDDRFARYGKAYPDIDLAIMENGQYDKGWRHIHVLPSELPQAISDLAPRRVLTYHNSKYALANHSWTEPLDSIYANAEGKSWQLLTPRIGEAIQLDRQQSFDKWW
ncbi:L-ascorbate metabolism protein UlaG (beta-lactamase superfamily) [Bacteroides zoogleoformans]|uniref:MBL fold metallo-hydrolase n=2 Tax=Bacteroides zoogleoformans TaxID=28119 RepID=A0ABM6TBD1_9BACE|nr:MBL fold metallo-hydrolase [Bacteroides zoogleoformans]TWJ17288.1 L-ascorbate metabolism protein UlaG (beta-lactamase superfamily) [Bacteroides zoogleoformans]